MDFSNLNEVYADFFTRVKKSKPKADHVFFMALDAEWYNVGNKNFVLSYQIATISEAKAANIIEYTEAGNRLTLTEIIKRGILSVVTEEEYKNFRGKTITIILVSHHFTAEWSVLADRDEPHIISKIVPIRNQPVTGFSPIKIEIDDVIAANVRVFDNILIAPNSFRSLQKLSSLQGDSNEQKIDISQFYKENMHLYLRNHPDDFGEYALRDSELTLKLFLLLQKSINELVNTIFTNSNNDQFKLYRTLASASVTCFQKNNIEFEIYRNKIKQLDDKSYNLVKQSYLGGRNEGYFVGRTNEYIETKNKIWVDIDFIGCYPTAMGLCPKIDPEGKIQIIERKYSIDNEKVKTLEKKKVPTDLIQKAREALSISVSEFNKMMIAVPKEQRRFTYKIREIASEYNNELIDKWYQNWQAAKQTENHPIEHYLLPGFARIKFKFPKTTNFPCLPFRHAQYGLLYVLEGETVATAAEIMLAMDAGAEIEALYSVEYPIVYRDNQPVQFLKNHLSTLARKRNFYKAGSSEDAKIMEKLVKEFTNSLYGKFSQAIHPKTTYDPGTKEQKTLGQSAITEPCIASLTTSAARAALSSVLLAVEKFNAGKTIANQITVISATTDGLLIGIPTPEGYTVTEDFYTQSPLSLRKGVGKELREILEKFGCENLLDILDEYLPIRQMKNSRLNLTEDNDILEIKHIADEVISIKTRGQIGRLSTGECVLLAKANLKPPLSEIIREKEKYKKMMTEGGIGRNTIEANWILNHLEDLESGNNKIQRYHSISMRTFTNISKSDTQSDLEQKISDKLINPTFDWKRRLVWRDNTPYDDAISPFSQPHSTTKEVLQYRDKAKKILKEDRIPTASEVLKRFSRSKAKLNKRGGEEASQARMFIRAWIQEILPNRRKLTYKDAAAKLNEIWKAAQLMDSSPVTWTEDHFKKAKLEKWEKLSFVPAPVIKEMAQEFTENAEVTINILYGNLEVEEVPRQTLEYIFKALWNQPVSDNIDQIPSREQIEDFFSTFFSEGEMIALKQLPYNPHQAEPSAKNSIRKILKQMGIPTKSSKLITSTLIGLPAQKGHKRKYTKR